MIVTDLLGYCWACACTWAAADSGSSQKHAIISECEHNLTFMSPARDQFARTTARFCTRSLLIVVAEAPARRSRRMGPDKPFLAGHPTIRQSGYIGKEHNDAVSVASAVTSHFINDSRIDIVGERLGLLRGASGPPIGSLGRRLWLAACAPAPATRFLPPRAFRRRRPRPSQSRACTRATAADPPASYCHRRPAASRSADTALSGRRGARAWMVNRSSGYRRSASEKHPRWRHQGSRSGRGTAPPHAGRGLGELVCRAHDGRHQTRGLATWWQLELDDVRELPLIHVPSDLELAAGHAYIAEEATWPER